MEGVSAQRLGTAPGEAEAPKGATPDECGVACGGSRLEGHGAKRCYKSDGIGLDVEACGVSQEDSVGKETRQFRSL